MTIGSMSVGLATDSVTTLENETAPREEQAERPVEQPPHETANAEEEEDRHNFALAKDGAKVVTIIPEGQSCSHARATVVDRKPTFWTHLQQ